MFVFEKTPRFDIRNHMSVFYGYNYTREKIQGSQNEWRKELEKTDSASIDKYGERKEELRLWAIEDDDTADSIATFQLNKKKEEHLMVKYPAFFENFDLKQGDTFDIDNLLYDAVKFFIEEVSRNDKGSIMIIGRSWLAVSEL
jgi:hypothetical protein